MSPDEFRLVVEKIRPFTDYIYLHVLGEPLLHPKLDEILTIAENAGLNINITTNGGLLERKKEMLLNHSVRQINISLHDAEENIDKDKWTDYLQTALNFSKEAATKSYVSLRLWNTSNAESAEFNTLCINKIAETFQLSLSELIEKTNGNGVKLSGNIYFNRAPRFEWPDENAAPSHTKKTCYALRDHIAILADGQVVPCCLDADANLFLGNIFTENLAEILEKERAVNIKKGFEQYKIVEPLCATCGFIVG
jgi:radical SAM protein with 4Fe4S-binding SPASM domain